MVEAAHKVSIKSDFRGEEFRIPHHIFVASSSVQPSPVGVGKRVGQRWLFGQTRPRLLRWWPDRNGGRRGCSPSLRRQSTCPSGSLAWPVWAGRGTGFL